MYLGAVEVIVVAKVVVDGERGRRKICIGEGCVGKVARDGNEGGIERGQASSKRRKRSPKWWGQRGHRGTGDMLARDKICGGVNDGKRMKDPS